MLAHKATIKDINKLFKKDSELIVQEKFDGVRCLVKDNIAYTRQGKPINFPESNIKTSLHILNDKFIFDGELIAFDSNNKILPRKEISGLINKGLHSNLTKEEANSIYLVLWDEIFKIDYINKYSNIEYQYRYNSVKETINYCNYIWSMFSNRGSKCNLLIAPFSKVTSIDEIKHLFNSAISKDKEGIIVKSPSAPWEPKRVKTMLKLKQELTVDLRVVGYEPGTGKYEGMLGALICKTDDSQIRVNVGTGFTDEQRELNNIPDIGSIVEIKYNAVIDSKDSNTKSLFLPVFIGERFDKNVTSSFEEL